MAPILSRVDGPYALSASSTYSYTGAAGDGSPADFKWAYVGHILYRTSGASVNVTGTGWSEIVDDHVGESVAGGVWYGAIRGRVAIPSGTLNVTLPAGPTEAYLWVAVYYHAEEFGAQIRVGNNSYSSDPITPSQDQYYDPFASAPGASEVILAPWVFHTWDNAFVGSLTVTDNPGGGGDPAAPATSTNIEDLSTTTSSGATLRSKFFAVYSNLTNNFNYALDYSLTQDVTNGDLIASGYGLLTAVTFTEAATEAHVETWQVIN